MTVGELIQRLQNYHDATPVLVDGYEDGYDDMCVEFRRVVRVGRVVWWSGEYEDDRLSGIEAVVLGRTSHKTDPAA